jgi:hypothetical protein
MSQKSPGFSLFLKSHVAPFPIATDYCCGRFVGMQGLEGPRGGAFQHLVDGIAYGMVLFYIGQSTPTFPVTDHTPTKHRRNEEIRARYAKGETIGHLARLFDISVQRVSQIVLKRRK